MQLRFLFGTAKKVKLRLQLPKPVRQSVQQNDSMIHHRSPACCQCSSANNKIMLLRIFLISCALVGSV